MSEVFLRNDAVVADVNVRQRLITLLAVPWNQEAEVPWRGEMWNEVFRRGAFDELEDHVGRVRVNREHKIGDTVGKLVFADPKAEDGLITRAKIVESERGNDTLALADEDAISPSIGYQLLDEGDIRLNRRTKLREVVRAFLHHLSLVESPAFEGAKVLEVRENQILDESPPDYSSALDEAWADPEYLRSLQRLDRSRT